MSIIMANNKVCCYGMLWSEHIVYLTSHSKVAELCIQQTDVEHVTLSIRLRCVCSMRKFRCINEIKFVWHMISLPWLFVQVPACIRRMRVGGNRGLGKMISFFFIRGCAQFFNLDDWIYTTFFCLLMLLYIDTVCEYNFEYLLYFGWHAEMLESNQCGATASKTVYFLRSAYICTFIYVIICSRLSELVIYYTFEQFKMSHMWGTRLAYRVAFVGTSKYVEHFESEAFN